MKSKLVWSMAALLAGAGIAAAQDDGYPAYQSAADVQVAGASMPVTRTAGRMGMNGPAMAEPVCMTQCAPGGADYRFYGRLEYLLWHMGTKLEDSDANGLPPFRANMPYGFRTVSYDITNPVNPQVRRDLGGNVIFKDIVGIAHLNPQLFSGSDADAIDRNGGRITLGMFLDPDQVWSAEVSYFQLERKGSAFRATAAAAGVQFTTGLNDVSVNTDTIPPVITEIPVTFDADFAAGIDGTSTSRLYGLEANVVHRDFTIGRTTISEIYGVRFLDLEHRQTLTQLLSVTDDRYIVADDGMGGVTPVTSVTGLFGNYFSRNQFYAAQVGLRFDTDWSRFFVNGTGKFAFGAMRQELNTDEDVLNTEIEIPEHIYPNTHIRETRTRLAFALEGNLNAGYHITDNVSVFAGYNLLVMTRVATRKGLGGVPDGDGTITFEAATTNRAAAPHFAESRFYVHGLNVGVEVRY